MQITDELPVFRLAGRKLETFNLGNKAKTFVVANGFEQAEVIAPASVASVSVAQRLHGDWYAEARGSTFCVSGIGGEPAAAINATFAKVEAL